MRRSVPPIQPDGREPYGRLLLVGMGTNLWAHCVAIGLDYSMVSPGSAGATGRIGHCPVFMVVNYAACRSEACSMDRVESESTGFTEALPEQRTMNGAKCPSSSPWPRREGFERQSRYIRNDDRAAYVLSVAECQDNGGQGEVLSLINLLVFAFLSLPQTLLNGNNLISRSPKQE
jgi:hypothetical protein